MRKQRLTMMACVWALCMPAAVPAQEGGGAVAQSASTGSNRFEGQQLPGGSDRTTVNADSRRGLSLAVYNNGFALVRDQRQLPVLSGLNELEFTDVATELRPGSIRLDMPDGVTVQSRHFSHGAPGYRRLLQAHVGHMVRLIRHNPATGEQIEARGRLLAVNDGQPLLRIDDRIEVADGRFPWRIAFERLPEGKAWQPGIRASVSAEASGAMDVGVSYITGGLGWAADYDLILPPDWRGAQLSGWANVTNNSGTDYDNARLALIAGDVAVSPAQQPTRGALMASTRADAAEVERSAVGGAYHRYELGRPVSVADAESRQLPLLELADMPVKRLYRVRHRAERRVRIEDQPQPVSVEITVGADGAREQPLPAGLVRVYQRGAGGALQWLGEDRIGHTPVDAAMKLVIGRAFDVQARRRQTAYERLSNRSFESAWEIELTNASDQAVHVAVEEQLSGEVEVLEASPSPADQDAQRLEWRVQVEPGGSATVRYRVRVAY